MAAPMATVRLYRSRFLLTVGWLVLALACGASVASNNALARPIAVLPLLFFALLVFAAVPWLAYVAVMLAVCSIAYAYALPQLNFGAAGLYVPEIVLLLGFCAAAFGQRRFGMLFRGARALHTAFGLFATMILVGLVVGILHGAALRAALVDARPVFTYACFWVAWLALSRAKWRERVFAAAISVSVLSVVLQVLQIVSGSTRPLFLAGSNYGLVATQEDFGSFLRVRPPGLTLVYVVAAFSASYLLWGPRRRRVPAACLLIVCFLGILLSLNRNMLAGLIVGLVVAAVLVKGRKVVVIATLILVVISVGSLGASLFSSAIASNPIVERVLSLGNYSRLSSTTLSDRFYENAAAENTISQNPITGIGWGPSYGATVTTRVGSSYVTAQRQFIHNQYFGIWMRTGIVGLLALLASLVVAIQYSIAWSRRRDWDELSWLGPAVIAALVALMASSVVGLYLTTADSIVPLSGVLAVSAVLRASSDNPLTKENVPKKA